MHRHLQIDAFGEAGHAKVTIGQRQAHASVALKDADKEPQYVKKVKKTQHKLVERRTSHESSCQVEYFVYTGQYKSLSLSLSLPPPLYIHIYIYTHSHIIYIYIYIYIYI